MTSLKHLDTRRPWTISNMAEYIMLRVWMTCLSRSWANLWRLQGRESALNLEGYDFEDACQYYSNSVSGAEVVLTRDRRGFEEFDIRHITAEDFLNEYFAEQK